MSFTAFTDCFCPRFKKNRFDGISPEDFYSENLTKEEQENFNAVHLAFENWSKGKETYLTCPHCEAESKIDDYNLGKTLACSNIGFTFWNWSEFTTDFLNEIKTILGSDIKVILGHL